MTGLPTNLTGGETGHIDHHNHLHLAHSQLPHPTGSTTDFMRADGLWAPPPGAGGAAGFSGAFAHRYVDWAAGSDTNDGFSPATAKKTLQAAHDSLPATQPGSGGTVWAAPGVHQITGQLDWTRGFSMLRGAGRNATRFRGMTNDATIIRLSGDYVTMSDFTIGDESETSGINAMAGIWLDGCEWPHLTRIRFDQLGKGRGAGLSFDASPAGVRMEGLDAFGDWGIITHCEFRSCYVAFKISSATNGWVQNCATYGGVAGALKWMKRSNPLGSSSSWRFIQCWWVGAPGNGFAISLEHDGTASPPAVGNIEFIDCTSEFSGAGGGFGGYYVNLNNVMINGSAFTVTAATGPMVRCGPDARNVVVGQYTRIGGTPVFQVSSSFPTAMKLWQSSDYSGVPTVV